MAIVRIGWFSLSVLIAGLIGEMLSAGSPGVRPRASVADYPAHQAAPGLTVGAALIPRSDVKKIFAADLNGAGYIVIEAGVFPSPGQDVDLSPGDFMLLTDAGKVATRPVDAQDIAGVIGRQHSAAERGQSDVYTSTGVSIARVPTIDPATGREGHATVVGAEETVGTGAPPSSYPLPAAGPNLGAIEQELWAKSLPDGRTAVAVAGYLYFPKPSGKTNGVWELTMDGAAGRVKLTLPTPR